MCHCLQGINEEHTASILVLVSVILKHFQALDAIWALLNQPTENAHKEKRERNKYLGVEGNILEPHVCGCGRHPAWLPIRWNLMQNTCVRRNQKEPCRYHLHECDKKSYILGITETRSYQTRIQICCPSLPNHLPK